MPRKELTDEHILKQHEKAKEQRRIFSLSYYHKKKTDPEYVEKEKARIYARQKDLYENDEKYREKCKERSHKYYLKRKERLQEILEKQKEASDCDGSDETIIEKEKCEQKEKSNKYYLKKKERIQKILEKQALEHEKEEKEE